MTRCTGQRGARQLPITQFIGSYFGGGKESVVDNSVENRLTLGNDVPLP